jgi:hypothetical protein
MTWTDPSELTWAEGSPLTAADMNTYVKNNLLALRALNVEQTIYTLGTGIGTSSTSFVDADPLYLTVEIEISSDRLLCYGVVPVNLATGEKVYFDLIVNQDDSTDVRAGDVTNGLAVVLFPHEEAYFIGFWTGLQPGTKTVRLQVRAGGAYAVEIEAGTSISLTAMEV